MLSAAGMVLCRRGRAEDMVTYLFSLFLLLHQQNLWSKKYLKNSAFHLLNIFLPLFNLPEYPTLEVAGIFLSALRKLSQIFICCVGDLMLLQKTTHS